MMPSGRTTLPARCLDLSPLFATLTKTPGVGGYSSHSGTRLLATHHSPPCSIVFRLSNVFKVRRRGSDRNGRRHRDWTRGRLGHWEGWGRWVNRGRAE